MIAHRIWAFIHENEVKNTIVCENYPLANSLVKNTISQEAFAVEITQIPAAIGHTYENGRFKDKEGKEIQPLPTAEEEVKQLKSENSKLNDSQSDQDDLIMQLMLGGN